SQEIRWIRFDPMDTSGEALIQRMQLTDSRGRLLKTFRADDLRPANDIGGLFQEGDRIRVVSVPQTLHAVVHVSFGCDAPPPLADHFRYVTPVSLAIMSVAAAAFLAACLIVIGADAFAAAGGGAPAWRGTALWLAMLFLLVFSGKLLLMREHTVTG